MKTITTSLVAMALSLSTLPAFALSETDIVADFPDNSEVSTYLVDAVSITQWGADQVRESNINSRLAEIARAADGKVYVRNLLASDWTGCLVGQIDGDKLTFALPQVLRYGEDLGEVSRVVPEFSEGTDHIRTLVRDTENSTITYTFKDGKLVLDEDIIFGFINEEGDWNGYSETDQVLSLFEATLVKVPEDAETFDLSLCYETDRDSRGIPGIYTLLHAAKKDNKLYVKGFSNANPESWVVADIEGNTVTFTGSQYLGSSYYGLEYLCPAKDNPVWNAGYMIWEHDYSIVPSLTLAYDEEAGTITATDKNDVLTVNSSPDQYVWGDIFANPKFAGQPEDVSPYPQAPVFNLEFCSWNNGEEPQLTFQLRPLNVNGQLLDKAHMAFRIYVDGEPYTFKGYQYWMDEDLTDIPWGFMNPFMEMSVNGYWVVTFEGERYMKEIAIRAVYTLDGEEYLSAPIYPDGKTDEDVKVEAIDLNYGHLEANVGDKIKLVATVFPSNATDTSLSWSSSNEAVASVSQSGLVTIINEGTAVITVSANDGSGVKTGCTINATSGVVNITVDGARINVYDINGTPVAVGADTDVLRSLSKGIYIVKSADSYRKLIVK